MCLVASTSTRASSACKNDDSFWQLTTAKKMTPSCEWNIHRSVENCRTPHPILSIAMAHSCVIFRLFPFSVCAIWIVCDVELLSNTMAELSIPYHIIHHHSSRENVNALTDTLTSPSCIACSVPYLPFSHDYIQSIDIDTYEYKRKRYIVRKGRFSFHLPSMVCRFVWKGTHSRNVSPLKRLSCSWHMDSTNTCTRMRTQAHMFVQQMSASRRQHAEPIYLLEPPDKHTHTHTDTPSPVQLS